MLTQEELLIFCSGKNRYKMTEEERNWCINESICCSDGFYKRVEIDNISDCELARIVLNSWLLFLDD